MANAKPDEAVPAPAPTEADARDIPIPFLQMTFGQFLDETRVGLAKIESASAQKDEVIAARNREITAKNELIQKHGAKIGEILGELYALMIDPLAEGKMDPESTFLQLKEVAAHQRQQLHDMQGLPAKVKELTTDLGMARILLQKAKTAGSVSGLERLPGGGVRLMVELDVDEAEPLLGWADGAGEDPAVYIARQIKDALVAVTSS